MTNVFDCSTYKDFLRSILRENSDKRGFQASLAKSAFCQPSYLSQVLSEKADLLPDHAAGIATYLELNDSETEYFLNLILLGRAKMAPLKKLLTKKLAADKSNYSKLSGRVSSGTGVSQEVENFYYSSWFRAAIHILTSVPEFQTVKAISQKLNLPTSKISSSL